MAVIDGACRFHLWWVHVSWVDDRVYKVRFATRGAEGRVPPRIRQYCGGQRIDPASLRTTAIDEGAPYATIYRAVRAIPYGATATYGEIARAAGTSPRVVGMAMKRNPTPLVIPCHRVVAKDGIGGFAPGVEIKEALLAMEAQNMRKPVR